MSITLTSSNEKESQKPKPNESLSSQSAKSSKSSTSLSSSKSSSTSSLNQGNSLRRRFKNDPISEPETSLNDEDDPKLSQAKSKVERFDSNKLNEVEISENKSERDDFFPVHNANIFIVIVAIFFRLLVGLHSYSGESKGPIFGDFEAQRHWMEITIHTPLKDWYRNTGSNDLTYWGLDYPPLSAYWAYITGLV